MRVCFFLTVALSSLWLVQTYKDRTTLQLPHSSEILVSWKNLWAANQLHITLTILKYMHECLINYHNVFIVVMLNVNTEPSEQLNLTKKILRMFKRTKQNMGVAKVSCTQKITGLSNVIL